MGPTCAANGCDEIIKVLGKVASRKQWLSCLIVDIGDSVGVKVIPKLHDAMLPGVAVFDEPQAKLVS